MITPLPQTSGSILGFKLSGELHDADYRAFVPVIEAAIEKHGKVRLLAQFEDFHGWDVHAMWDDIKFATRHCSDVERIALIGDRVWEKWMAGVCKPFTLAKIEYFDVENIDKAWAWLAE
jgi:hypothetical protein